ncbi:hypothetical protein H5410_003507 [Solanum commersonii]|uniref:Uncharacterized protein n=1 Tax=Solanum commersonii TaxID=4109 RepID=A0A9J6B4W9_SOLCO|nr:hypothetical protein H5410_003507 [Solanum commersonii]
MSRGDARGPLTSGSPNLQSPAFPKAPSRPLSRLVVKTTDREVALGLGAMSWPQGLASHYTKDSSRIPSRTVVYTTGRKGGHEPLGSSLPRLGSLALWLRLTLFP